MRSLKSLAVALTLGLGAAVFAGCHHDHDYHAHRYDHDGWDHDDDWRHHDEHWRHHDHDDDRWREVSYRHDDRDRY